jgi:hypothetical protein
MANWSISSLPIRWPGDRNDNLSVLLAVMTGLSVPGRYPVHREACLMAAEPLFFF